MKTTVAALPDGWKARGDEYHWDHVDGCFIERDGRVYVLYTSECKRVVGMKSLTGALRAYVAFSSEAPCA